jgi:protein-arginine kinase activator protein McsA
MICEHCKQRPAIATVPDRPIEERDYVSHVCDQCRKEWVAVMRALEAIRPLGLLSQEEAKHDA